MPTSGRTRRVRQQRLAAFSIDPEITAVIPAQAGMTVRWIPVTYFPAVAQRFPATELG